MILGRVGKSIFPGDGAVVGIQEGNVLAGEGIRVASRGELPGVDGWFVARLKALDAAVAGLKVHGTPITECR